MKGEEMKWHDSVRVKLIGFFLIVSTVFMITLLSVINILKHDALIHNASDEVNLATIQVLNNLQNNKYKVEEIVLALASVSRDFNHTVDQEEIIRNLLEANNSGLIISGGIWFAPYAIDSNREDLNYFFNREKDNSFTLVKDYLQNSPIHYRDTEYYVVASYLKKGETYWTKVYQDPVTKKDMITVASPIYRGDTFIGVASVDLVIKEYNTKIFGAFKYPHKYLMMIDREGAIITKSKLLKQFSDAKRLYSKDSLEFTKDFQALKPIFDDCVTSQECNESLAKALSNKSLEISEEEGIRIAKIFERRGRDKGVWQTINFIDNDPILQEDSVVTLFHFPLTDWKIIVGISKVQLLEKSDKLYQKIINVSIILILLVTLTGYFLLKNIFIKPIEDINKQLIYNSKHNENHYALLSCTDRGEIGLLVNSLNLRTKALVESQEREASEMKKRKINEKLLEQQSKLAAMGGMMDAVAHQWKQPLNALSMYSELIKMDVVEGNVDEEYINKFSDDIQLQIRHMLNTLDEFRTFFRPNKEEENFLLIDVINSVLFLTKDEFLKNSITVKIVQDDKIEIYGFKNEFKHLILNIINNAKDAFNENNIKDKEIDFALINDTQHKRVEIIDNAGGIPTNIINDIFKANVTSKADAQGTGIGLFMSMQIAKKHGATILAENTEHGAKFIVEFPKEIS